MFSRQRGNDTKIKLGPSGMKEEYQKKEISGENNGKLFLSTLKYVSTLKSKHNIVRDLMYVDVMHLTTITWRKKQS